ncbi:hypothetical protein O181_124724 [Austropuccinia psidii MF-1]|uniref:Uncharacterized protein n=1 Tax=Austropuccinia psidii MF-1 TaxID=1389203 RepID=A0A9Q3KSP0_9BASI|nr:hypothetical protein [Austropuccinia psidii MF-1]
MGAANASHANPYACAGSQQLTRQSLRLCRLPTIHMPILTPVKVPKNAKNSLRLYRLPNIHTPILTLVKVPHNAKNFLHLCRLPKNSHANSYACAGSQQFTRPSLCLCTLPTIHMPILMLVKAPENAKNSLRLYRLPTIHTPILALVKVANNADNFLRLCRLPTIHMPILMHVQAPNNSHANPYACSGS